MYREAINFIGVKRLRYFDLLVFTVFVHDVLMKLNFFILRLFFPPDIDCHAEPLKCDCPRRHLLLKEILF
jgi:hypothetical protein